MIRSIERLRREHDALYRLLSGLERQVVEVHRQRDANHTLIQDILLYLTEYADLYYHPYEDLLYRRLAARNAGMTDTIESIQNEHRRLAESGRSCCESFETALAGDLNVRRSWCASAFTYLEAYRAHMQREENDIVAVAKRHLQPADWLQIDTVFQWSGGSPSGLGGKNRYQALHERIRAELERDFIAIPELCCAEGLVVDDAACAGAGG